VKKRKGKRAKSKERKKLIQEVSTFSWAENDARIPFCHELHVSASGRNRLQGVYGETKRWFPF
jgi:hypothetical protein